LRHFIWHTASIILSFRAAAASTNIEYMYPGRPAAARPVRIISHRTSS